MSDLPPDPFGPEEDLLGVMKGLGQLHSAAMIAGLSEKVATDFISNVFIQLMAAAQNAATPAS
jgi:hypothetical protein